jgi:hypothetical protein
VSLIYRTSLDEWKRNLCCVNLFFKGKKEGVLLFGMRTDKEEVHADVRTGGPRQRSS